MSAPRARIVLASASPRRRALLTAAGVAFALDPADVDESLPDDAEPVPAARLLAERKARAVLARQAADALVLAADTVVALPLLAAAGSAGRERWRLLGKPADPSEAERMLSALSATRHAVVTGVCVLRASDGRAWVDSATTWVSMRALAREEVAAYVASGEWRDKAGGYAIQESADRFVTRLEGAFDNVVGLPVTLALDLLRAAGASELDLSAGPERANLPGSPTSRNDGR